MDMRIEGLKIGDEVSWSSQSGGHIKSKFDKVIEIVREGGSPSSSLTEVGSIAFDFAKKRKFLSYVIEVPPKTPASKPTFYWPLPHYLKLIVEKPEGLEKPKKRKVNAGPRITKGLKEGVYGTPRPMVPVVEKKFGKIAWDLAANRENALAENFFSEENDAFRHDWHKLKGILWLNPPFTFISSMGGAMPS